MPSESVGCLALVMLAAGGGCISTTQVNIGTKTSLERQLIGELEPLSEDEVLAASVRAQAQGGLGPLDDQQGAALAARRRQLFNRDDVDEAKQAGCLGEGKDGELVARLCDKPADAEAAARVSKLVAEENADRRAIIDWAVAADPALTPADRPEVVRIYQRIIVERARTGEWVQDDTGGWVRR